MRPASFTFTTVLCLVVIVAALWYSETKSNHPTPELSSTHEHHPKLWSDLWVVMSPGFR